MRVIQRTFVALSLVPTMAASQTAGGAPRPADRLLGLWVGASVAPAQRFGLITDRQLFVAAVRAEYVLERFGPIAIASTMDVIPLAILSNTPTYVARTGYTLDGYTYTYNEQTGRAPVYGAGIVPAGLQIFTAGSRSLRAFIGGSAGGLWFTRNTPIPDARRLNFMLEAGGGIELIARSGRAVVVGYKYQHLSNAGTAALNPGFDTQMVYVGMMRPRSVRRSEPEQAGAR